MEKKTLGKMILTGLLGAVVGAGAVYLVLSLYLGGPKYLPIAAKFTAAYDIIDKEFVGDADMDEVLTAAYRSMVEAIDDRWSLYMTPEEYADYHQSSQNTYTGIGITVAPSEEGNYLQILAVAEESPAADAGILPGDRIRAFDGEDMKDKTSQDLKVLISGKNGGEFTLTLMDESGAERSVSLRAGEVYTDPVEYEMLPDSIAYIKIVNFDSGCADRAIEAIEELTGQGAEGIVFDVRNDPGGFLHELTELLDYLLPEGDLFVSVSKGGEETVIPSDERCLDIPMAVLLNENTYSAAEFFAAALSEYGMAELVGEPSTGKSRSQVNLFLPDGSAIHLSTNGYLTPNRVDLAEQGGLTPDYEVELSQKDSLALMAGILPPTEDEQLQKAVDTLDKE